MKYNARRVSAWLSICLIPTIAYTQDFRVAQWDMSMDQVAAVEPVQLKTTNATASGSHVDIAGVDFDVTYTFAQKLILTQEQYTSNFTDDAARDAAYTALRNDMTSKYGNSTEEGGNTWVNGNATITVMLEPAALTVTVENVESPEERLTRKKRELEEYKVGLMEEIGASDHPIRIQSCKPFGNDFSKGVNVQVLFDYYGPTTIKYMHFTVAPYDEKGRQLKCTAGGHSDYTFEIMGPFRKSKVSNDVSWDQIWKNQDIACVQLAKLEVEYVNGTTYTYVNELDKISWPYFKNQCD